MTKQTEQGAAERAAFEALPEFVADSALLQRQLDGQGYVYTRVQGMWEGWQARAATNPTPEGCGWISVDDERKPELGQQVLLWMRAENWVEDDDGTPVSISASGVHQGEYTDRYSNGGDPYFDCFSTPFADQEAATHWMPEPQAPAATSHPTPKE